MFSEDFLVSLRKAFENEKEYIDIYINDAQVLFLAPNGRAYDNAVRWSGEIYVE